MPLPGQILPALAPLPQSTGFPYPTLVQIQSPLGSITSEAPTINGVGMPGQWILTRLPKRFGWQEQQANFMSGAYVVPKGDPLAHFEYEIRIFESGTFTLFRQILGTLLKKPVVALPGLPASAALGINDHPFQGRWRVGPSDPYRTV
jgi:hypothetical protein